MNINKAVIAVIGAVLSTVVFAGGMQDEPDTCWGNAGSCAGTPPSEPYPWLRVTALSLGAARTTNGETQTFYVKPTIKKTYYAADESTVLFNGELFLGAQRAISPMFSAQVGLALAVDSNAHLSGNIWENADPNFSNYVYNYAINHAHLAIKGKLLADFGQNYQPYVSASIGAGVNNAHGFTITTKRYEEVPAPIFKDNMTLAFAYTLGLGVQTPISDHWQAGLGYEFASWGPSKLARGAGQTVNAGPEISNTYTNALLFLLSYTV